MIQGTQLKPRPCGHCGADYTPQRFGQRVCSPTCARRAVKAQRDAERAHLKARKLAIKTVPVLIKAAQKRFNAFIRERDRLAGHNCISSGRQLDWSGNGVDAGHYRSIGAASHLRFNEDNVHAQSKHDNNYKAGNAVDYRIGLIARIGLARVEALEASNEPHKWDRAELIVITDMYVEKLKQLKKERE